MKTKKHFILLVIYLFFLSQHLSAQFANFPPLETGERIRILIKPDASTTNKMGYTLKPSTRIVAEFDHVHDSILTVNVVFNDQVNYGQHTHISTIDRIEKFISKEKRATSAGSGFKKGFLIGAGGGSLLGVIGFSTWEYREETSVSEVAIGSVILGTVFGLAGGILGSLIGYASPADDWRLIWQSQ